MRVAIKGVQMRVGGSTQKLFHTRRGKVVALPRRFSRDNQPTLVAKARPSLGRLRVITAADRHARYMALLKQSCRRFGIRLSVVGLGSPWRGYAGHKVHMVREALAGLPGNEVVLFTDAHDSILLRPADEILRNYITLGASFLMSAERNCWPDGELAADYPSSDSPYRYLNSGGWIALVKYAIPILNELKDAHPCEDDQRLFTGLYLSDPGRLQLDHGCHIFQTLAFASKDIRVEAGELCNSLTDSRPCVLHANGNVPLEEAVAQLWGSEMARGFNSETQ